MVSSAIQQGLVSKVRVSALAQDCCRFDLRGWRNDRILLAL